MKVWTQTLKVHVALNVRDVEASVDFYRRLFGIEPAKLRAGYAKFDVECPPVNLSLNQSVPDGPGTLSHLGIQVPSTEDVLSMRQRWQEAGLTTRDEFQTTCCFALQDKTWVQDPDGNAWEAFVVLKDNLPGMSSCCLQNSELVTIGFNR
jgi:catechol 2,3-dioxygenase-like lactoylglutathione lyase family enzyme